MTAPQSARHGTYHGLLIVVVHIAVASENPYHTAVLVSSSEKLAVDLGIALVEQRTVTAHSRPLMPVAAPRGQHSHIHAEGVCARHDVVHMVPIVVVGSVGDGWRRRVKVVKRQMSVCVGHGVAVELGYRHGLYHGETLRCTVGKIGVCLLARQTMEQLPGRVAEIEEGRTVLMLQKSVVLGNHDATV